MWLQVKCEHHCHHKTFFWFKETESTFLTHTHLDLKREEEIGGIVKPSKRTSNKAGESRYYSDRIRCSPIIAVLDLIPQVTSLHCACEPMPANQCLLLLILGEIIIDCMVICPLLTFCATLNYFG